jgi:hypothetical protein
LTTEAVEEEAMSRRVALALGTALILVVGAVSISFAVADDDEAIPVADDRFEAVATEDGDTLDGIIDAIEIDPVETLEALADGATLAEIIEDNGGDPGEIADEVEGMAGEAIDEALADGIIDKDEADDLREFVADTVDGFMNLPIGVLLSDLEFLGAVVPGVPFEVSPDDPDQLRDQLEEQFGEEFGEGEFDPPFFLDPDGLAPDLPDEVRERLEGLQDELENLDLEDLLENFDSGGFSFDESDIPDELRQLLDQFLDGEEFRFEGDGFDFDFRFNEEGEEEAA